MRIVGAIFVLVCGLASGCSVLPDEPASAPTPTPSESAPTPTPTADPAQPPAGSQPPAWLGQRPLPRRADGFGEVRPTPPSLRGREWTLPDSVAALRGPGWRSQVVSPAPRDVLARSTWQPSCPVAAEDLAWLRVSFWGFDQQRHTGELLVHRDAVDAMTKAFRQLWRQRFPIEEMRITRMDEVDAPPTGDGNNTSAFVCRASTGGSSFSQHAYGRAVDVNPFHNPYLKGDLVLPELASWYLDRSALRPGQLTRAAIDAFVNVGWEWGGNWWSLKDYHHFSANGR